MTVSRSKRIPLRAMSLTLIATLGLWVSPAGATMVLYESFPDLVEKSEGIVIGTVLAKESRYGADNAIYTFWTLGDLEIVSGVYTNPQLDLRILGGEVNGDQISVLGAPSFAIGERVLLFLRGNGRVPVPLVGWTQGVYRVRPDGAVEDHEGNRVFGIQNRRLEKEHRIAPGLQIVGPRETGVETPDPDLQARPRPSLALDRFVSAIREQDAARATTPFAIQSAIPVALPNVEGAPRGR